jgi:hypothetical protein
LKNRLSKTGLASENLLELKPEEIRRALSPLSATCAGSRTRNGESAERYGQLSPIAVYRCDDRYELADGVKRLGAAHQTAHITVLSAAADGSRTVKRPLPTTAHQRVSKVKRPLIAPKGRSRQPHWKNYVRPMEVVQNLRRYYVARAKS